MANIITQVLASGVVPCNRAAGPDSGSEEGAANWGHMEEKEPIQVRRYGVDNWLRHMNDEPRYTERRKTRVRSTLPQGR